MYEAEEKALRDYFGAMPAEEGAMPDEALERAVRAGMERGRTRRRASVRLRAAAVAAAAVLLLLASLSWLAGPRGELRSARPEPQSWGSLEKYRSVAEGDITVSSALDTGRYVKIGTSSGEKNGYSFTVDAVIADERGMIVLYSTENRTDEKAQIGGFQLKGSDSKHIPLISYSGWNEDEGRIGAAQHIIYMNWGDGYRPAADWTASLTMTPDNARALTSSSNKYRTVLEVPIKLDPDADIATGEDRKLNKKLVIGGQSLTLERAYYGTTGIYVDYSYSADNSKKLFSAIYPTITEDTDGEQAAKPLTSSTEMYRGEEGRTLIFQNDNRNDTGALTLRMEGIQALDKSKLELVLDTERQEVLQSPDDKLAFSAEPAPKGKIILSYDLGLTFTEDRGNNYLRYGISLENEYTDGAGKRHQLDTSSMYSTYRTTEDGGWQDYAYNLGTTEKLPQPLTFTISTYPSPVVDPQEVRIR